MTDRSSTWSLRARVLMISGFALVAALLFGGFAMYWAASIQENQMIDAHLEHLGATVASFAEEELADPVAASKLLPRPLTTRASASMLYRYQVWSRSGQLMMRSREAPARLPMMPLGRLGFASVAIEDEDCRALALPSKNGEFIVQVAENIGERWAQASLTSAYYVSFMLIPFLLVLGTTAALLRQSLHSVETIADQLRHRNPLDLTPLQVDKPPRELLPVLKSVDTLFAQIGRALSSERRFTSVAAHEMRTPLAGLRAQAQLAMKSRSYDESSEALRAMLLGVDRVTHMLDQLLDLARLESLPKASELQLEQVEFSSLHSEVMFDFGARATNKALAMRIDFSSVSVNGHPFGLYLMMRNLIANAILYAPVGGRVELSSERQAHAVVLRVDDSGPGIRSSERVHAFERFNRLGQTRAEGVGLGLAIVLSVVEMHEARIQLLDSPLGGLRVEVTFTQAEHGP